MSTEEEKDPSPRPEDAASHFIAEIIEGDLAAGVHSRIVTRFPPEPNGYLHIGHAKAICLNFGLARQYGGVCNLRFDDTNPEKEDVEYVESIKADIRWLGFDWEDRLFFASDYFEQLYGFAVELIEAGKAYICSLSAEEIREYRGNYYIKGKDSPYRQRSVEENLELFRRMRAGEFAEGEHTLRAKIDMSSQNMNMRDPPIYRIKHAHHHRTGDAWHIYPMYDFAHALSDAVEGITHSICTLEFENHRPLYDWCVDNVKAPARPRQYEFARLNLNYTVMSKRRLLRLVEEGHVAGWDDPRMPTLAGFRRRGFPPAAIRAFAERVGVAKANSVVDVALLEHTVRESLNESAPRVMGVLRPLKVVIDNWPEGQVETFDAPYHPEDPSWGSRPLPFGRELYIEQDDFREDPPKKWFRLAPGREIRLRYACLIRCVDFKKDAEGRVVEVHCTWDPDSRGGTAPDGRKVKGTSHWVSAQHAVEAEVRLYDRLFASEDPMAGEDFLAQINPNSIEVLKGCKLEPSLTQAEPRKVVQFERLGYFVPDSPDRFAADGAASAADESTPGQQALVFNRTIGLRDSWAKLEAKQNKG